MALAKYWSRLATNFSSSFPKHSSSVIGLYDLGAVGSFFIGFLEHNNACLSPQGRVVPLVEAGIEK